jgi:hypothetical protein
MVLPLVIITFVVYFALWLADIHLTLKTVKSAGAHAEVNPIMKRLLGARRRYLWAFKAIEMGAFLYLIFYLTSFSEGGHALIPLLVYILFYSILFANNSRAAFAATGRDSAVTYLMVVLLAVALTILIYLNYGMFDDLRTSYERIAECREQLSAAC